MAYLEQKYCNRCKKDNLPFENPQPGHSQEVGDNCLDRKEQAKKSKRLSELLILVQDPEKLAHFLLRLV